MSSPATLLLVPGLNNTGAVWSAVVRRLTAHGVRCAAPTLPAVDSVEVIAEQLAAEIPGPLLPVGFSFGGYVALALAESHADRVVGCALIGSTPFADSPQERERRLAAARRISAHPERYAELVGAGEAVAFHPDSPVDPRLRQHRREMVGAYGAERFGAHQRAAADRPDRSAVLDRLRLRDAPLAFAAGADDRVVPLDRQRAAATAQGAPLFLIPGAGHLAPLEQPEAVADWLLGLAMPSVPATQETHP